MKSMDSCGYALRRWAIVGVALTMATFACVDDRSTPASPDGPAPQMRATELAVPTADELGRQGGGEFRPRLDPRIEVVGPLVPGSPITVRFSGTAAEAAEGASLRLYVPQIPGERVRAADPSGPTRYAPRGEARRSALSRGQVVEGLASVTFNEEGMYHLQVVSEAPRSDRGPDPLGSAVVDLWLLILDVGGTAYGDFRPDVFPEGAVPGIGPLKWYMEGTSRRDASLIGGMLGALRALLPRQSHTYFDVRYSYNGSDYAAVGAKAEIQLWDGYAQEYAGSLTHTVPSSGIVTDYCARYGEELHGVLELPFTAEVVGKTNLAFFTADHTDCGDTIPVYMTARAYMTWDLLTEYAAEVESIVGYSRGLAKWSQYASGTGAYYDPNNDWIYLDDEYDDSWVVAHEFGHALARESLGPHISSDCPNGEHSLVAASAPRCALSEGIADYMAFIAVDAASYLETFHVVDSLTSEVEGNVAALILDLVDSNNESGDDVTLGAYDVWTVFKTCQADSVPRIDAGDFVWCLENRVSSTLHGTYFPGSAPGSVSSTRPGGWDSDDIRTTWLTNFAW